MNPVRPVCKYSLLSGNKRRGNGKYLVNFLKGGLTG